LGESFANKYFIRTNDIFVTRNQTKMFLFPRLIVAAFLIASSNCEYCNRNWYETSLFQCCQDYELCSTELRKCCGKHCYGITASLCCEGRIIDKCHQFYSVCCGSKCVDRSKQVCCDGVPVDACASIFSACCNGRCYDTRSNICCNGQVVSKCADDRYASCCSYQCYNNNTATCCSGYYILNQKCPKDQCCGNSCCAADDKTVGTVLLS